jgi:hypothetical protein
MCGSAFILFFIFLECKKKTEEKKTGEPTGRGEQEIPRAAEENERISIHGKLS